MINIAHENLLTLTQARARIPGRPSLETLWRWRQGRGTGGPRLPTIKVGRKVFVLKDGLEQFLREITRDGTPAPTEQHRRDNAELEDVGI